MCVDWTVMDDGYVEGDEVVIIAVRPLSDRDMVLFPMGAQYLTGTIIDDDGKDRQCNHWMHCTTSRLSAPTLSREYIDCYYFSIS